MKASGLFTQPQIFARSEYRQGICESASSENIILPLKAAK
jgi:hypothetical protein